MTKIVLLVVLVLCVAEIAALGFNLLTQPLTPLNFAFTCILLVGFCIAVIWGAKTLLDMVKS